VTEAGPVVLRALRAAGRVALRALRAAGPAALRALPGLRSPAALRFWALVAGVAALGVAALVAGPDQRSLLRAGAVSGPLAPLAAIAGSAVLAAAVAPRTLLAFVGGALFGWLTGAGYVLVGVTIGAGAAFGVGRLLGRAFVAQRLRGRAAVLERAVAGKGVLAVLVVRLIPLVPFGISNYAFGTIGVRPAAFLVGTAIGAAPTTLAYAALGAATARGDAGGMALAGSVAAGLGIAGSCGTYLVWRNRPKADRRLVTVGNER
jgi:uncharacterized membrane protein YdjX (TVP38/TMEM64 family)